MMVTRTSFSVAQMVQLEQSINYVVCRVATEAEQSTTVPAA